MLHHVKLLFKILSLLFKCQRTTLCFTFEINFTNICLTLISSEQTLFHRSDDLPNNGYFIEIQSPLHACFEVHEPSRQPRSPAAQPKKEPPLRSSRRDTIHKSTGRECVSVSEQRGLFAAGPRLFITFASMHPSLGTSPLMQPSIRLH